MKKVFHQKESYKHFYAKHLLYKWLCQHEDNWMYNNHIEGADDLVRYSELQWMADYCNFYMELKFRESKKFFTPISFSKGHTEAIGFNTEIDDSKVMFIPDITIFESSRSSQIIEVVNTNPVSDYKLRTIKEYFNNDIAVYEIDADWILSQISRPKHLKLKCLSKRNSNFENRCRFVNYELAEFETEVENG